MEYFCSLNSPLLYKKAKKGWPKDFNGVAPPPALDLGLNNVGVYNGLDELLYSCLRLTREGKSFPFKGVEQFDVAFSISNPSTGKIKLENFREFNAKEVLNNNQEIPDYSGKYQIDTGVYSAFVQVNSSIYEFEFQLTDSLANEFMLVSSKIIR